MSEQEAGSAFDSALDDFTCPCCDMYIRDGHADDCELDAARNALRDALNGWALAMEERDFLMRHLNAMRDALAVLTGGSSGEQKHGEALSALREMANVKFVWEEGNDEA